MELIHCIRCNKIVFKTHITSDKEFATKFIFAIEIRIQCWLRACIMYDDQSMIDDRLINFDPIIESVLNSTLNIVLPPNFIVAPGQSRQAPLLFCPEMTPRRRIRGRGRQPTATTTTIAWSRTPPPSRNLILPGNTKVIAPNRATPTGCAPAGGSKGSVSATVGTRLATLALVPFPPPNALNSKPTLQKFAGR